MNFTTKKLYLFVLISFLLTGFISCSSSDDNEGGQTEEEQIKKEEDLYNQFITPELEATLAKLGQEIHRGINPPNVEGYYLLDPKCIATTVPNDYTTNFVTYYQRFHSQSGLSIKFQGYEFASQSVEHIADGAFITGEGDKFSIFFEEHNNIKYSGKEYQEVILSVFSAELSRDENNKVNGLKDYQYSLLMKDDGGCPGRIPNNTGRLFNSKTGMVECMSQEEFEKKVGEFHGTRSDIDSRILVGVSSASR